MSRGSFALRQSTRWTIRFTEPRHGREGGRRTAEPSLNRRSRYTPNVAFPKSRMTTVGRSDGDAFDGRFSVDALQQPRQYPARSELEEVVEPVFEHAANRRFPSHRFGNLAHEQVSNLFGIVVRRAVDIRVDGKLRPLDFDFTERC